ncbi:urea carboxylase-associated family protein [Sphingomonas sp. SUN039]|uniref:urea carboxylase-associated family protein n=1 Tax=Sphingomonas sp. SUN039 TaxID=2937787 RepID=UPI0021646DCD|nr:urea carboxylase-associated family protein [Sphingomonas sp. SUN039]UVO54857.1 urea carboxylase-associated family protein [Sphingomonas sp. SUN039]
MLLERIRPATTTSRIEPRSGVAFTMRAGQTLTVTDPLGRQVADLLAFNANDVREAISSGRTLDYASKLNLTTGDTLWSNRSTPMLEIVEDTVGRHDFLLTPCSKDTFRIIYGHKEPHRGCFGNLAAALAPFGVTEDMIPVAFNCFMNVPIKPDGSFEVLPPISGPGDYIRFEAKMDLIVGLTACSALQSNGGSFKPIDWAID